MINIQEGKIIPIYPNNEKYYRYRRITEDGLNMNIMNHYLKGTGYRVKHIPNKLGGISEIPYQLVPVNKNYKCLGNKRFFQTLTIKQYREGETLKFWNEHINRKLKQAERLNKCKS